MTDITAQQDLDNAAQRLAEILERRGKRVVFAESCTGGLVSATLTRLPGISAWYCGSAVVYQIETKQSWLGIPADLLDDSGPGPVSREVAAAMAEGVLANTPHADFAVSVTGHLGPGAPDGQDGLVFIAATQRASSGTTARTVISRHMLPKRNGESGRETRLQRQILATRIALEISADFLDTEN